jgi:creatinine amidohydrolase
VAVLELGELLASDVAALDRARSCVVVAVSPIEQHGPHLPLATDIHESVALGRRLCERLLSEPALSGWTYLLHPALPIGADVWTYPGSLDIPPATVARVVTDVGVALGRQGFSRVLLANNHGGPRHNLALDDAARAITRKTPARALSLAGPVMVDLLFEGGLDAFFAERGIAKEDRAAYRHDFHAGAFETAEMLALFPDKVRDGWQKLAPFQLPFAKMRRDSALAPGAKGYFGAPALASREMGEAYVAFIIERLVPDMTRFLLGEAVPGLSARWRVALRALASWGDVREAATRFGSRLRARGA